MNSRRKKPTEEIKQCLMYAKHLLTLEVYLYRQLKEASEKTRMPLDKLISILLDSGVERLEYLNFDIHKLREEDFRRDCPNL